VADRFAAAVELVAEAVGAEADGWDLAGRLPGDVLRRLAAAGVLCPDVPAEFGGLGLTGAEFG
jgi:methoxymalonate biosynthesis protein